ncbi:MAG: hypothetical protein R3D63_05635 [Paracoccaceae bacterium]
MPDPASLETFLLATGAALKAGDLPLLADLADRVEAALAEGTAAGGDPRQAARVLQAARENERLLLAAMKGVRAARARAAQLTDRGRFSTYDAGGRRDLLGMPPTGPARRL